MCLMSNEIWISMDEEWLIYAWREEASHMKCGISDSFMWHRKLVMCECNCFSRAITIAHYACRNGAFTTSYETCLRNEWLLHELVMCECNCFSRAITIAHYVCRNGTWSSEPHEVVSNRTLHTPLHVMCDYSLLHVATWRHVPFLHA